MSIRYDHFIALRGGFRAADGIFAPPRIARHGYWLVAETQTCSPSLLILARVPMDNLG
ncbi:hypothetical protein [Sulfuricystis multivorans]|uniref:hypothetical protein n=1 Tax=Sulfuricystis multivorans TaxID=2211108 RepID=UPI0015590F90|nr:hypothetical protein [Sulfuricystis multivorans]